VTQGKTYVRDLFTWKNQSISTLAPFERMMLRQTNIWLFQNDNTVEWELEQVCKMWGEGKYLPK